MKGVNYATGVIVPGAGVAREVIQERVRQDEKWGEQNHPDGTGMPGDDLMANSSRLSCDRAAENKRLTFRHILLEEVYEALAESGSAELRNELIQVAAVAVAWVEAIDRRADQ